MDIKLLNLEEFDINDYDNKDAININIQENTTIFFSYPYYSHNDIDYQYRFTFEDQQVFIDEIKNDNNLDFDNVILLKNIDSIELIKFNEYLSKLIDFRDGRTFLEDGIINLNLDLLSSNEKLKIISNNKKYVLYEIYNNFLE
jgi:hypothetical protein